MDYNNVIERIEEYAEEQKQLMKEALPSNYALREKIEYKITEEKGKITLSFIVPDYAKYVDQGIYPYGDKRPFSQLPKRNWKGGGGKFKPAIKSWANKKNIRFNTVTDYSGYPKLKYSSKGFIKNKVRDFLIARSIVLRGTEAHPFLDIPSNNSNKLATILGAAFAKDLAFEIQTLFNEAGIGK